VKAVGRPKVAGLADAQRARILEAARQCFIEDGFHAATMAHIAARAGMSAGLIYRYFVNKNAIVLAITERELEVRRARIAELRPGQDHAARLAQLFREFQSTDPEGSNAALSLEVSAEATRVPEIAEAVAAIDRQSRHEFQQWLGRPRRDGGLGMEPREAEAFALLLTFVVDGLVVRSAREPGLDAARLKRALAPLLEKLG
jgi:AcrR family transcriptional regulator